MGLPFPFHDRQTPLPISVAWCLRLHGCASCSMPNRVLRGHLESQAPALQEQPSSCAAIAVSPLLYSSCSTQLNWACACRRYTLPLEEFYTYNGTGPNITAYINGEPKSHKSYNCSIHCGGQQFCGAGNPGRPPITPLPRGCLLLCHAE